MLPCYFFENRSNRRSLHIEKFGQGSMGVFARGVELSNIKNVFFLKKCIPGFFPSLCGSLFAISLTIFANHVATIIVLRSKKQVVWPNASTVVAFMAHAEPFWNWAVMNLPRIPMGPYLFYRSIRCRSDGKSTIAIIVYLSRPFPAVVKGNELYFIPESLHMRVA